MKKQLIITLLLVLSLSSGFESIGQDLGPEVITLGQSFQDGPVTLMNEDGSFFCAIGFNSEKEIPGNFFPIAFHPDYYLLTLEVKEKLESDRFLVFINENETKIIQTTPGKVVFENWEEHLENRVSYVTVNTQQTPLYVRPNENIGMAIRSDNSTLFKVHKVKGSWMKVRFVSSEESTKGGWIQWKEENKITAAFHYYN